jgi:hypothetical protein
MTILRAKGRKIYSLHQWEELHSHMARVIDTEKGKGLGTIMYSPPELQ